MRLRGVFAQFDGDKAPPTEETLTRPTAAHTHNDGTSPS
jgi:hypothetical protein